ncbi:MAG: hypothetical protein CM1200mP2_31050 [Planctomycetaceae bacterium]|nr:hypothetical protein [Planctomycetaceae bacterium]GIS60880.1 MAG: hypothetical protein CM1200mP2_31050 [Planctomycetaceae bacterium]
MQTPGPRSSSDAPPATHATTPPEASSPACPVCGGQLIEIRHKLVCSRCHSICETCCEGGRG